MVKDNRIEGLRRLLRARLHDGEAAVSVPRDDLQALLDEVGRLQQSSDRLRRQNRRLRLRCQRAGQDVDDADTEGEAP